MQERNWEHFKKLSPRSAEMSVSIYKGGKLSMTQAVREALGSDYVQLLYDREHRIMGIRPSTENGDNVYMLRKPKNQNIWTISLVAFLKYYGIFEDVVKNKYRVSEESGVYVIDFTAPT